jgi:tetraprenyl-beta-curcumene synthase
VSTRTHTNNGHASAHTRAGVASSAGRPLGTLAALAEPLELPRAFAETVLRYLTLVLPLVARELAHWRTRAAEIPDPGLRGAASDALRKRGNIEGAALFATLAPGASRRASIRALVALQTAYNYLDALSEMPSETPAANAEQLHRALLLALSPGAAHVDYYAYVENAPGGDAGYLTGLVDACRDALATLPSYEVIAPLARAATARIVDFQTLNLSEAQGGHDALQAWALEATPDASRLQWWETAAAAGSSLGVHALIATAGQRDLDGWEASCIERVYFPWAGALHSLLDSVVDRGEDHDRGQRSLVGYYPSATYAAARMSGLASRTGGAIDRLANADAHRVIVTAMCSYYLSAPQCATFESQAITRALTRELGVPLNVAIVMFRVMRAAHALTGRTYT